MFDREQQRDQDPLVQAQEPQADLGPQTEKPGGNQADLSQRQAAPQQDPAQIPDLGANDKRQPTLQADGTKYYGIANQITSLMEGGSTKGSYEALTTVADGGIISYGKHQATLASGSLGDVINAYLETAKSPTAKSMREYLPRVSRRDASLKGEQGFLTDLKNAAKEQAMKDAQDMVFNIGYWKPAVQAAASSGIQSPLGLALLYDTKIQGGMESIMDKTRALLGGDVGAKVGEKTIDELTFLKTYNEQRAKRLENLAAAAQAKGEIVRAKALRGSTYRCRAFQRLLDAGNLNVAGPEGQVEISGPGGGTQTIEGFDEAEVSKSRDNTAAAPVPGPAAGEQQVQEGQPQTDPKKPAIIGTASVKTSQLNVRKGPATHFAAVGQLKRNDQVQVTGTEGEWLEIQFNNQKAYVHGGFTSMRVSAPAIGTASANVIGVNIRQTPAPTAAKVGFLRMGDAVEVIGQEGKWLEIKHNGQLAFVFGTFMDFKPTPEGLEAGPVHVERGPAEGSGEEQQTQQPAPAGPQAQQPAATQDAATQDPDKDGNAAPAAGSPIDVAVITASVLNVRSGPGTQHQALGQAKANDKLDVTARSGEWLQVVFNGKAGFINGRYAALKSEMPPSAADMAQSIQLAMDKAPPRLKELMNLPTMNAAQLGEARTLIKAMPAPDQGNFFEVLQAKVPYASQRDNQAKEGGKKIETTGGNMCNLTSLAMCLEFLGISNPYPDLQYEDALEKVRQEKGLPHRTYASGWGGVAEAMGVTWGFAANPGAGKLDKKFWEISVRPLLRAGKSVMMSITGHIVRVQGVGEHGLVVDDPYGVAKLTATGYKFTKNNQYGAADDVGNDHVWSWEEIGNHSSNWVAWFAA